jgi:type II secretory pathway pseudopilin PulG
MKFNPTSHSPPVAKRRRAILAFTLAEVLAALAFMAIVIPVAVEGLRVASRAGQVGLRKAVAARVAERVLNEASVTGQLNGNSQRGMIQEGVQQYQWSIRSEPWSEGAMRLVTVLVTFPIQGQEYDVRVSTLMDNSSQ